MPMASKRFLAHVVGMGEGAVGIADLSCVGTRAIGPGLGEEKRRVRKGGSNIDYSWQGLVFDRHKLGCILGDIAVLGYHQSDGLPNIPYPVRRQRPLQKALSPWQGRKPYWNRCGKICDISMGKHGNHARKCRRRREVNPADESVCLGTSHHYGMQHARERDVVDELAAAREETPILGAR